MVKTILATGQSNMVGRGTGGPFDIDARVTCWNNLNDITDLTNLGSVFVTPDRGARPFVNSRNNIAVHACSRLAALLGEDIRLILVAKGAESITTWMGADGTPGPMYDRIVAVLGAASVSSVDYLLWHQGEGGTNIDQWNMLVDAWESDGFISPTTPIVMGQLSLSEAHATGNSRILDIVNSSDQIGLALCGHYPTSDGTHYLGYALADIGRLYAEVALRLMGEKPKVPATTLPTRVIGGRLLGF